jgi:uncharacterized protein (TIGR02266 family)
MSYFGAAAAAQSRELLGMVLETLQRDRNIPPDVLAVSENIARAIGALFEAERASSDLDGRASVRHAMGSLSQTMALLQDVRTRHDGIETATRTLAEVMSRLFPLAQAPSLRPSMPPGGAAARGPSVPGAPPVPRDIAHTVPPGSREKLEANVGATTESNFFVGFSGDIAEGGVFVATYLTIPVGQKVEVLVTLPGGFEKTIPGTVRFVRDPMDMDADPGIGVRFDRLDQEARELILRFIRKRPPLFYDE